MSLSYCRLLWIKLGEDFTYLSNLLTHFCGNFAPPSLGTMRHLSWGKGIYLLKKKKKNFFKKNYYYVELLFVYLKPHQLHLIVIASLVIYFPLIFIFGDRKVARTMIL